MRIDLYYEFDYTKRGRSLPHFWKSQVVALAVTILACVAFRAANGGVFRPLFLAGAIPIGLIVATHARRWMQREWPPPSAPPRDEMID